MMKHAMSAAMMRKQKGKPDSNTCDEYIPISITYDVCVSA